MFAYETAQQGRQGHNLQPTDFSAVEVDVHIWIGFLIPLSLQWGSVSYVALLIITPEQRKPPLNTNNQHKTQTTNQQILQAKYLTKAGVSPEPNTTMGVLRATQQGATLPKGRHRCKNHCFQHHIYHVHLPYCLWNDLERSYSWTAARKKWNSICSQQICNKKNKDSGSTQLMESCEITPHFTTKLSMIYRLALN